MTVVGLLAIALVVVGVAGLARRRADAETRARFVRRVGFGLGVFVVGFFGLFVIGETISDPGGLKAVLLICAWLVPLAAAIIFAWFRPRAAGWLFAAVSLAVTGLSAWFALDSSGWRSFEGHHGPIRAVTVFALSAALIVYGLKRTALAGLLLLYLGVVPVAISSAGHGGLSSLAAASVPPIITGALYLAAAIVSPQQRFPTTSATTEQPRRAA